MLIYTMLSQLARGASLQQCRVNDVQQRKQRSRLAIGLGIVVIIFLLLCTVACGGGDGSLAKGGINMIVVSGQARIRSDGGNTLVVEGQEAVITTGDQIIADEAGVELLLADGSFLYLNPDTDLQVVTFSDEGMARLSQLKGKIEVEAASPLLTIEISTSGSEGFALKTMQFEATPAVRGTTFRLWIDGLNAHLTVEAGEVNVTSDDRTAKISTGHEAKALPGGELIVSQIGAPVGPTVVAVATADLTPTSTPDLIHPSPTATATLTVAPDYLYPAPGLHGPGDGDDFKPNDDILLIWDTPTPLAEDAWYEVQLWREGNVPYTVVDRVKEKAWKVKSEYYPGRYQWRIVIVRVQEEGRKEMELSPPSQTWSFGWLRPSAPVSTAPTSPPISGASVDLTVYLRGTNNAQSFVALSGEQIDAGTIYAEGGTVYGDVAVRIGDTVYHFDQEPAPGEPEQLPAPYRLEFEFSDPLIAATEGMKPGFNDQKAQFWVGTLDYNSAVSADKPYKIEMTLYYGMEPRKHTLVSFLVADAPGPGESGGPGGPPPPPRRE
jgi:hypothetical protein